MNFATMHMLRNDYDTLEFRDDIPADRLICHGDVYRARGFEGVVKACVDRRTRRLVGWDAYAVVFTDESKTFENRTPFLRPADAQPIMAEPVGDCVNPPTKVVPAFGETLGAALAASDRSRKLARTLRDVHELTDGDLISHREAWRTCIVRMQGLAAINNQPDNADYYAHELAAFDRVFGLLCDAAEPTPSQDFDELTDRSLPFDGRLMRHVKTGGVYEILTIITVRPVEPPRSRTPFELMPITLNDMDTLTLSTHGYRQVGDKKLHTQVMAAYAGIVTNTTRLWLIGPRLNKTELPASGWRLQSSAAWSGTCRMVAYRSKKDGSLWLRPEFEFFDGRFESVENAPA